MAVNNPDFDGAREWLDLIRPVLEYMQERRMWDQGEIQGWGVVTADPPVIYIKSTFKDMPGYINGIVILHEQV